MNLILDNNKKLIIIKILVIEFYRWKYIVKKKQIKAIYIQGIYYFLIAFNMIILIQFLMMKLYLNIKYYELYNVEFHF